MSFIDNVKKCIFVHIPRTAGKSIESSFKSLHTQGFCRIERHLNYEQILDLYPNTEDYFSFTVIRNPWSRMLSLYFYAWRQALRKQQIEKLKMISNGFEYFLNCDYFHNTAGWSDPLYTNQVDWVKSDKKKINKIIKYENLQVGWHQLLKELDLGLGLGLPKTNSVFTYSIPYKKFYNNVTKNLIAKRFQQDIDTFKYTF